MPEDAKRQAPVVAPRVGRVWAHQRKQLFYNIMIVYLKSQMDGILMAIMRNILPGYSQHLNVS